MGVVFYILSKSSAKETSTLPSKNRDLALREQFQILGLLSSDMAALVHEHSTLNLNHELRNKIRDHIKENQLLKNMDWIFECPQSSRCRHTKAATGIIPGRAVL